MSEKEIKQIKTVFKKRNKTHLGSIIQVFQLGNRTNKLYNYFHRTKQTSPILHSIGSTKQY